jgi:hypothetical protein
LISLYLLVAAVGEDKLVVELALVATEHRMGQVAAVHRQNLQLVLI